MGEALFFILGGIFIVSALLVALVAARGRGFPENRVPLVAGWLAAVAIAMCVFAVIYGNEREPSSAEVASVTEGEGTAGGETGEEAELTPESEGEQENGVANAGEQLEGEAGESEAGEGEGEAEAGATGAGNPEAGKEVFAENCSTCHGATGHGGNGGPDLTTMPKAKEQAGAENCSTCHGATGHGGNGGPDLTTMPKAKEQAGAEEQVKHGGGGMPPFEGTLSEEEIKNVASYVVQEINGGE